MGAAGATAGRSDPLFSYPHFRALLRTCVARRGGEERGGVFRLCKIKDRFTDDGPIGYRDLCLGLEVGWNVKSEGGSLEWVHVQDFETKHVRTHICEVQIMLRSMYEVKASGAHINFVRARNLLCE